MAVHSGGAVLQSSEEAQGVNPAEELCRFLNLAPVCYQEFRLCAGGEHPVLNVSADWQLEDINEFDDVNVKYDSVQDLALAMQRFAHAHGLNVGLSGDETYLHVVRVRRPR